MGDGYVLLDCRNLHLRPLEQGFVFYQKRWVFERTGSNCRRLSGRLWKVISETSRDFIYIAMQWSSYHGQTTCMIFFEFVLTLKHPLRRIATKAWSSCSNYIIFTEIKSVQKSENRANSRKITIDTTRETARILSKYQRSILNANELPSKITVWYSYTVY